MPAVSAQLNDFIMPAARAVGTMPARPTSVFARIVAALNLAAERRTELEVGRLIEQHGGRLTDSLEREIERRFV